MSHARATARLAHSLLWVVSVCVAVLPTAAARTAERIVNTSVSSLSAVVSSTIGTWNVAVVAPAGMRTWKAPALVASGVLPPIVAVLVVSMLIITGTTCVSAADSCRVISAMPPTTFSATVEVAATNETVLVG